MFYFSADLTITPPALQPYGELFVMRSDGSRLQQLTDKRWEDGAPTWIQPQMKRLTDH